MTDPGPDAYPAAQPHGATAATVDPAAPAPTEKKGVAKWVPVAGAVAVAGVLGVGSLTGWFGIGDPSVGDCIQLTGETEFSVVDCGADEAEYRIVGIQAEQQTYPTFVDDPTSCSEFATTEVALWTGSDMMTEEGTVYCAEAV